MIISYDADLIPTYKLNRAETEELEQTGFIQDDDAGVIITKMENTFTVAKINNGNGETIELTY